MYYTYVLQSLKDNKLYIGHTRDLKKRVEMHNKGQVTSTKQRSPFKLLYYEACNVLDDAIKREHQFKTGFGRNYLKKRLDDLKI